MKHDILIGRPCVDGTHRSEVGNFLLEVAQACLSQDSPLCDLIGEVFHVPIQRSPVEVARNQLVQTALDRNCSFIFMVDDDQGVEPGFFASAMQHLMNNRPCVIGTPACTAGPDHKVCVFEGWGTPEHVSRQDAARRRGIEKVSNIGCACIGYNVEVFRKLPQPWFKTTFDSGHTRVIETEDCWCHRRLRHLAVDLYVDWDHWATHYKVEAIGRPTITDRAVMDSQLSDEVQAEIKSLRKRVMELDLEAKKANAALDTLNNLVRPGFKTPDGIDGQFLAYELAALLGRLRQNTEGMRPQPLT